MTCNRLIGSGRVIAPRGNITVPCVAQVLGLELVQMYVLLIRTTILDLGPQITASPVHRDLFILHFTNFVRSPLYTMPKCDFGRRAASPSDVGSSIQLQYKCWDVVIRNPVVPQRREEVTANKNEL